MTEVNISIPTLDGVTATVDTAKLPDAVVSRLMEMALTTYIRSTVTSAFSNELNRAEREHDVEQDKLAAEAKKNKEKYTKVAFDKEAFTSDINAEEFANERIAKLYEGEIRAARGKSGENKALIAMVTSNVVSALKAKGKKHKEAVAMIAGDPFGFIERSARKRAGEDAEAYKSEIAKLNALYVDPARAILGVPGTASTSEGEDADDLI